MILLLTWSEVVDVRQPLLYEVARRFVDDWEVVRGMPDLAVPRRRALLIQIPRHQPPHVLQDGAHVLDILFRWVGVVQPHVRDALESPRDFEVEVDRLGMTQMQVSVGFGREPRDDSAAVPLVVR